MSAPVWILSVDLQTRTASFETGLGNAARAARGAFSDIRAGSNQMAGSVKMNMVETRESVMLLGEEFGVHLPRALTSFIARLGPVGAAMEAAFPFLAIAALAALLIEHLVKLNEAGEKLTQDQIKFGTAAQNAFNALDDKLLQAGIRADELRNDHLGALTKQLELIDHQSMAELSHTFGELAKAADVVFSDLKSHWYTFGIGADGAKHALTQFQAQYEDLLSKGKDKEASDLLRGTRDSAQKVLEAQKQIAGSGAGLISAPKAEDVLPNMRAMAELKKAGVGYTHDEVAAQETLVDALNKQMGAEDKIASLKKLDDANAGRTAAGAMSSQRSAAAREAADSQTRMGAAQVQADKAVAEAQLTVKRGSIEQRLALDLEFANRELAVQMAGNAAQVAALDKLSKDYPNQLKALKDKALEITQQHDDQVAELTAKASVATAARDLQALELSEKEKIEATQKGSQARLAAINAAIKQEELLNLQDTNFYRELLNQRAEVAEQNAEETAKLAEAAGREAADNEQKIGELKLSAWKTNQALQDSARRISEQQKIAEETQAANADFALKQQAYAREIAALDTSGKDYQNKLKELQDKEKQLTQQHENELAAIREKAEEAQNQRILAARDRFNNSLAQGLTQSIMGHETWAKMVTQLGDQVVSGMIENAVKSMLADDMTKERDAAAAARQAYKIGLSIGGPAGMILGPTFAAVTFAAQMAFADGGIVPGVGRGDVVPAMLTPGEGIVPGGVMDGLRAMARSGTLGTQGNTTHIHYRPTFHVQTIDSDGVSDMLNKHSDQFVSHIHSEMRRLNR